MPELPEVETVKNTLKDLVLNKTIKEVQVNYSRIIQTDVEEFKHKLINQSILNIERRGKFLLFIFNDYIMVSHLRMEGKYFLKHESDVVSKHDHIIFKFTDQTEMRYNDTRKFGVMYLFDTTSLEEVERLEPLNKLGLEPFDANFNLEYLKPKFSKIKKPIKTALLDQTIICGLGNIYADEVVFMSGLNPNDITCLLKDEDLLKIIDSSKKVLAAAIKLGGTTIRSFVSSHAATGLFQNELLIHTKGHCPICGGPVKKIFVGGRGTYFCPHCQKKKTQVIGITGSIATGKSVVSSIIKEYGYPVIDLDKLTHDILKNSKSCYKAIVEEFTNEVIDETNNIDRKKLGQIIFSNPLKKKALENIVHPLVIKKMNSLISSSTSEFVFCDVPLLYESHLEELFDYIILAYVDYNTELQRLMVRDNIDEEYAIKKIASQMPIEEKRDLSDFIVDNSYGLEYTKIRIKEILNILKGE